MFDLTGRTALVTGASGGIGGSIAKALHEAGAKLAISGTRQDALEALAGELGGEVQILPCDLADPAATAALAGGNVRELLDRSAEEWDEITDDIGVDDQREAYRVWSSKPNAYPK